MNKRRKEETASAVLAPAVGVGLRNIQDWKSKRRSAHRTTAAMRFGRSTALSQIALRYRYGQLRIAAKR